MIIAMLWLAPVLAQSDFKQQQISDAIPQLKQPAGDWIATANHSTTDVLLVGVDVDATCSNAKTPLTHCPLAVYFNLSAAGAAPTCYRVNSNLDVQEIVPGEFVTLPQLPWNVHVMRRGSYFFLEVNAVQMAFVRSPRMEIHCDGNNGGSRPAHVEPIVSGVSFQTADGAAVPFHISSLSWGTMLKAPVVTHGHMRWSASQAIPGAVLRENNTTYLYFVASAQNMPHQESGGNVVGGVAHCPAGQEALPSAWTYLSDPVLRNDSTTAFDSISVFVNGVVKAPDGRYCLSFFGEPIMRIGFAFADSPLGPFVTDDSYTLGVGDGGKGNSTHASDFPDWASVVRADNLSRFPFDCFNTIRPGSTVRNST